MRTPERESPDKELLLILSGDPDEEDNLMDSELYRQLLDKGAKGHAL
jgi:hypothetical protein